MYQIGEFSTDIFIMWATCNILTILTVVFVSFVIKAKRCYQRRRSIKGKGKRKAKPQPIDGKAMLQLQKEAAKSSDGLQPHRTEEEKETNKKLVVEDIEYEDYCKLHQQKNDDSKLPLG